MHETSDLLLMYCSESGPQFNQLIDCLNFRNIETLNDPAFTKNRRKALASLGVRMLGRFITRFYEGYHFHFSGCKIFSYLIFG